MKTAVELAEACARGERSVSDTVNEALSVARARADENALSYVAREEALERARALDALPASGRKGRLFGVPIAIKDAICTSGLPTTSGSNMLVRMTSEGPRPYRPPYDATVTERLLAEGAVIVGKANMDEFAMGSSNETSAYGPVKNPVDPTRVPGGSSGGSAAAVAGGIVPVALGSDTGGSIRQPAAFTGIVGVKPTFGRVSRYGLIAFASSLDQIGPMTPDVLSAARVLGIISGPDGRDSTVSGAAVPDYEAACLAGRKDGLLGVRIGVPEEYFSEGLDPRVRERIELILESAQKKGARLCPVRLPHTHYGVATYYVLATAEASSNLARFDGVRFGRRVESSGTSLTDLYAQSRGTGFGPEVQRRILLGAYVLSAGFYDAYYGKAQRVRTLIRRDFERVFSEVDCLLTPTSPTPAFRLGERNHDPLSMYMADVYTLPASLAGIPALSLPIGRVQDGESSLPVGLQVLSPFLAEPSMFRISSALEELALELGL